MCTISLLTAALVSLLAGCAGSRVWAKHASAEDLHRATDFELCNGYKNYDVNPGIKTEILRRKLLTEAEWNHLIQYPYGWPHVKIGEKKCLTFSMQGYWVNVSQNLPDAPGVSVWRALGCEPTLFNLGGNLCRTYLDITFNDGVISKIECHATLKNWCEAGGFVNNAKK